MSSSLNPALLAACLKTQQRPEEAEPGGLIVYVRTVAKGSRNHQRMPGSAVCSECTLTSHKTYQKQNPKKSD